MVPRKDGAKEGLVSVRAWQFTETHEPLVLNEVAEPEVAPGEVLIDVKAAGLCHSDVGLLDDPGWLSLLGKRPITPGHEVAGVISEVGDGVTGWQLGDRVGICPSAATLPGYQRDGGYSSRVSALQEDLVRIPENVSFEQGAAGTDAGMTSHHAVMTAGQVRAGDKVGIIGLGGLGQIGARIAVLAGAEVHVAEINEQVWPLAREIGASSVVSDVRDLPGGSVPPDVYAGKDLDVIVDFAGFGDTTVAAVDTVRFGGRVVLVGMGKLEAAIDTKSLILKRVQLVGSMGGDVDDVRGVYDFVATGRLNPTITTIGFDEIPEGLEKLRNGEVTGRLVARIAE